MTVEIACHLNVLTAGFDDPGFGEALAVLQRAGCSAVVLAPFDPADARLPEWATRFRDAGLIPIPIAGQRPGADVSSPDPAERRAGEDSLRRMIEATVALGGDQLNGVPYGPFGRAATRVSRDAVARAAESVGRIADDAGRAGVVMTFEILNRYETAMLTTAEQARDFVARSGSPNLKVHLDSFHMAVEEADMLAAVRDTVPVLGYLELGQSGRGPLGTGSVDAVAVAREAVSAGYRGRIGVEAFTSSVLSDAATGALAIWRDVYTDGPALVADAVTRIRRAEAEAGTTAA